MHVAGFMAPAVLQQKAFPRRWTFTHPKMQRFSNLSSLRIAFFLCEEGPDDKTDRQPPHVQSGQHQISAQKTVHSEFYNHKDSQVSRLTDVLE
jgi:hypothetical protein